MPFLTPTLTGRVALLVTVAGLVGCRSPERSQPSGRAVTIYVSADRVFSEPVLRNYEKRSGGRIHPDEGRRLIDYLLSAEVERQLALSEAVQIPLHAGVA
jgi:hypothetical protein